MFTPEDQRLIDEAIAAGRVQRIERGQWESMRPRFTAPAPRPICWRIDFPPSPPLKQVREGTKTAKLVEALEHGATVKKLIEVTGWDRDTVYGRITHDLRTKGFGVTTKIVAGCSVHYLIHP